MNNTSQHANPACSARPLKTHPHERRNVRSSAAPGLWNLGRRGLAASAFVASALGVSAIGIVAAGLTAAPAEAAPQPSTHVAAVAPTEGTAKPPSITGDGGEVLHLRWEGNTPVLESRSKEGKVLKTNATVFRLPAKPAPADSGDPDGDRNILTLPEFQDGVDTSWLGRPGESFPHAPFFAGAKDKAYPSVFEAAPEDVDPDSVRLSLRQFSGPSWFELGEYRPGYSYTKRMLSNTHPYFKNFLFGGRYNHEPTWSFGKPGTYKITLQVWGLTKGGERVESNVVTLTWVVTAGAPASPTPSPAPTGSTTPAPSPSPSASPRPSTPTPSASKPSTSAPDKPKPTQPKPAGPSSSALPPLRPDNSVLNRVPSLADNRGDVGQAADTSGQAGSSALAAAPAPAGLPPVGDSLAPAAGTPADAGDGSGSGAPAPEGADLTAADGAAASGDAQGDAVSADSGAVVVDPSTGSSASAQGTSQGQDKASRAGAVKPWALGLGGALLVGAVGLGALTLARRHGAG